MKTKFVVFFACIAMLFASCQTAQKEQAEEAPEMEEMMTEDEPMAEEAMPNATRGKIVSISEPNEEGMVTVTVDHEEVPGFMKAMRMGLRTEAANVTGMTEGSIIAFEMVRRNDYFAMENVAALPEDTQLDIDEGGM